MAEAQIRELIPQPTAAVRLTQAMADLDLGALFGEHLPNVAHRLADMGVEPTGPAYGRYHAWGPETVDVEIGIPVSAPPPNVRPLAETESGEMGAAELPGGQAAVLVHRGSYDGLRQAYDDLHEWIHAQGREEGPGSWESYVDDPTEVKDEAEVRTEVVWPLA